LRPDVRLIAFDTAAAHVAAALLLGDRVLTRVETMDTGQSARLMPVLEDLMAEGGITWAGLSGIGVGTGPGNFTGIRIAVAAARGLAMGLNIPAIGVSGFEVLTHGRGGLALIPAPRGMAYLGGDGAEPRLVPQADVPAGQTVHSLNDITTERFVATLARVAASRLGAPAPRPAPLYVRAPDAAPPREAPPAILS
jgi:tRNA threonylcarbamoyladenosine biosynthesis protein TsaB